MEETKIIKPVIEMPTVVLVSTPLVQRGYYTQGDMAVDDLGIGYLYAALEKQGYDVHMFDSGRLSYTRDQLVENILELKPAYIGFSDPIANFGQSLELSKQLKEEMPSAKIIYGDIHASLYQEEILKNEPHVDYVICGDGDRSLPELIAALENGRPVATVPGLAYREDGVVKTNPPDLEGSLDSLPFPHRPSLYDSRPNDQLTFNIVSSRGCPGRCTFCSMATFATRYCKNGIHRWRSRSPQNIFDELRFLYDQGVRKFWFCDDNWIGERKVGLENALTLCELIIKEKLDLAFSALIRPDSLCPEDGEALTIMKKAGLCSLIIGLEASNREQLRLFGKQYDLEKTRETTALIHQKKIAIAIPYIMFFPYSTFDMLRENNQFLLETQTAHNFDSYTIMLAGFSNVLLEKKIIRDNLAYRPTTYKKNGQYKLKDRRIQEVFKKIGEVFRPNFDVVHLIRRAGFKASWLDKQGWEVFDEYMNSMKKIGNATASFFQSCLDQYEYPAENIPQQQYIDSYAEQWLEVIEQEKHFLVEFLMERRKKDFGKIEI